MKKIILCFMFLFITLFPVFVSAYTPSQADQDTLSILKPQLVNIIGNNTEDLRDLYYQLKILQGKFSDNGRLDFLLGDLKDFLYQDLQRRKQEVNSTMQQAKLDFLASYGTEFTEKVYILPQCLKYYTLVDDISFAYNFPTELTVATWYRETTCGYAFPSNGYGPFQITSRDYGVGAITEAEFIQTVIDFISFSKSKHYRYGNKVDLNISYTEYTYVGIVNHLALYNGGRIESGVVRPINPRYVFDNYNNEFSGASKDGVFTVFIKLLGL